VSGKTPDTGFFTSVGSTVSGLRSDIEGYICPMLQDLIVVVQD
jgi:hypothetical protein